MAAVVAMWCSVLLYSGYVAFTVGADDLLARFVGPIDDPSWMPPGQDLVKLAGRHYFGDWQICVGWGRDPNPYLLTPWGQNSLPGAFYFLALMGLMPMAVSIWIFFALTIGITALASFLLLSRFSIAQRLMLTVILFGSSIGMLFSLGRGALQGVAMGLVGLAMAFSVRDLVAERPNSIDQSVTGNHGRPSSWSILLAGSALSGAIMLKPYFAVLLLWPVLARRWRLVCITVGIVGVTSILGFALLPGGFLSSVQGLMRSISPYSSGDTSYLLGSAVGLVGFILSVVRAVAGPEQVEQLLDSAGPGLMWTPAIMWVAALIAIFYLRRLPWWMFAALLLASTQLILPTAQAYTMVWAPWAALVILLGLGQQLVQPSDATVTKPAQPRVVMMVCGITVIAAVVLSLVQIPRSVTGPMGWPVSITLILSPGMLIVAVAVCLVGGCYLRIKNPSPSSASMIANR